MMIKWNGGNDYDRKGSQKYRIFPIRMPSPPLAQENAHKFIFRAFLMNVDCNGNDDHDMID